MVGKQEVILPIQIGNDKSAWLRSASGLSGKIRLNLRRAAVNEKFDASDKTGVGRHEKKRSRRDFFGFANAAHGNLRDELVFDFHGYVGPLFLWRRFSKLPPSTTVLTERFYKTVVVGTESFGSELNVLFDVTFSRYPSVINA